MMKVVVRFVLAALSCTLGEAEGLQKLWSIAWPPSQASPYVWAARFSQDSKRIALGVGHRGSKNREIAIFDTKDPKVPRRTFSLQAPLISSGLSWSPDDSFLLIMNGSRDPDELVNLESGAILLIDKKRCSAWGLLNGPRVVLVCEPSWNQTILRIIDPQGGVLDEWAYEETVTVEDWNQESGWLALSAFKNELVNKALSMRTVILRLENHAEVASKAFHPSYSLRGRFLRGGDSFCSLPWSGQHTKLESAECWNIATGKNIGEPQVQGSGYYGDIQAGGNVLVSDDDLYIPFPVEGGIAAVSLRRSVWDVKKNKRVARWTQTKQRSAPKGTANYRRNALSPDGFQLVIAGDGELTVIALRIELWCIVPAARATIETPPASDLHATRREPHSQTEVTRRVRQP
jgi:hypothetical protein